jgi:hypothetical protein
MMKSGRRKKCFRCGMVGHSAPTCHVAQRGAVLPDGHDERAQMLIPTLRPQERIDLREVRALIARLLRSGGQP